MVPPQKKTLGSAFGRPTTVSRMTETPWTMYKEATRKTLGHESMK